MNLDGPKTMSEHEGREGRAAKVTKLLSVTSGAAFVASVFAFAHQNRFLNSPNS